VEGSYEYGNEPWDSEYAVKFLSSYRTGSSSRRAHQNEVSINTQYKTSMLNVFKYVRFGVLIAAGINSFINIQLHLISRANILVIRES
jgi:hypothetical protein